jgi:hypothetical protein
MSDLQHLTAAGNSSLIPGHTISPPRLIEWAEAETEAAENYLRTVVRASADLPSATRDSLHARAVDNLRNSPFAFGSAGFDAWALSAAAMPFLLWLSLRIRHPRVSRNSAAEFLRRSNSDDIIKAVWDAWGYDGRKNPPAPPSQDSPSNGGACSDNSRIMESPATAPVS